MLTKDDLTLNEFDHPLTERLCRILCEHEGVENADKESISTGKWKVKEGVTYKLWEYRLPKVRAILGELENG